MASLIQSPANFYETWRNDRRRQSTTFWERFGRHPDPDQSSNQDSNPGSLLVEILALVEVCALRVVALCFWSSNISEVKYKSFSEVLRNIWCNSRTVD